MKIVDLQPNHPQEFTLGSEISPCKLSGGAGCLYTLSDGRLLHLAGREADDLTILKLQPGESFFVCLHSRPGEIPYRSVWLSPATEKARAEAERPELERQLAASLELVGKRKGSDLAPTGTEGAVLPAKRPAIAAIAAGGRKRAQGEPIPLNVAFREIVRFVVQELNESGEQWSENSRQDLVSTLLIAAQKANLLCVWERGEAA